MKQKLIAETAPAIADGLFLEEHFYTAALFAPNYSLKDSYDFFAATFLRCCRLTDESKIDLLGTPSFCMFKVATKTS